MQIRFCFRDYWPNFRPEADLLARIMVNCLGAVHDEQNPNVVLGSVFGDQRRSMFGKVQVLYNGEPLDLTPGAAHLSFVTYDPRQPNQVRLPHYIYSHHYFTTTGELPPNALFAPKPPVDKDTFRARRFASMVASSVHNGGGSAMLGGYSWRTSFVPKLQERVSGVDWYGRGKLPIAPGHTGGAVAAKLATIRAYNYHLAFENTSKPGYVTEKIMEAMIAGCVPIYWGCPKVARDFNPASFVNLMDYPDDETRLDVLARIANDYEFWRERYEQAWVTQEQLVSNWSIEAILAPMRETFAQHLS